MVGVAILRYLIVHIENAKLITLFLHSNKGLIEIADDIYVAYYVT